ncbi:MAG TPA: P-II family nitrogen regulator [Caldithrix abyssi]|uniref:P-II family nitrogen regulator n=1 Tax=Caldithrix abyssi TaxID=187145 RepID=A0A7V1PTL2_CALAY|nr:P-II family nitrogen regulator [Caldithrix abyssi]
MKHIIAYIKPHKLDKVTLVLHRIEGLTGMTVTHVKGCGRGNLPLEAESHLRDLVPHVKIEIFCHDDLSETIVRAIQENAHTGLKGDGKIYICPALDAIRISNGERGENAV